MSQRSTPAPPTASGSLTYGAREIRYTIVRTPRATLGIEVRPDGSVRVRAPLSATDADVHRATQRKARWIAQQQRAFERIVRHVPDKEYVSGETHRYLGRQYRLKVIAQSAPAKERVRLYGRYFEIYTHEATNPEHTRILLERWYRTKAQAKLDERYAQAAAHAAAFGIEAPPMSVRKMKRRWGSHTTSSRILLHPDLVKVPTACIDYVALHELCHARYPHHGPAFYSLLEQLLPDWLACKQRLAQNQD